MFIEITSIKDDVKISINKNHIVDIWKTNENCGITTTVNNFENAIYVKESYEEVKRLLNL